MMYQPVPLAEASPLREARARQFAPALFYVALALLVLSFGPLPESRAATIRISEFMADNFRTLADEDGNYEDWIELHNSGSSSVNVAGYYLTDQKSDLRKWRLPAVTIPANGHLVVFASGKDRKDPLGNLHTNFKLSNNGEYLGLVQPDGVTIVSEYAPAFPAQATGVSYGYPSRETVIPLLSASAPATYWVPADDAWGKEWTKPGFGDASWFRGTNALGYDTEPARPNGTNVIVTDSFRDFTGIQGQSNWFYGYWSRRDDLDSTYTPSEFQAFPRGAGAWGAANFFVSNTWKWFPSSAASTEINRLGGRAAGDNGVLGAESHWAIRRWVSNTNAQLRIYGIVAEPGLCSSNAPLADGVVARIWVDGVEIFQRTLQGTSSGYSVFASVKTGSTVDMILDPGTAENDQCDNATFTATIASVTPGAEIVANSVQEWSSQGVQGANNWTYGYYDRLNDRTPAPPAAAEYNQSEFVPFRDDYFDGTQWLWLPGQPPYIQIGQYTMRPNGFNSLGGEQWTIRRWTSPVTATVAINWHLGKAELGGTGFNGRVYNKFGRRVDFSVNPTNFAGTNFTFNLAVTAGEDLDFILAPGSDDVADLAFSDILITAWPTLTPAVATDVSSKLRNINSSLYVRVPFVVTNTALLENLILGVNYDGGFVAYINGVEILRQNAPAEPAWDSSATLERRDSEALTRAEFNISASRDLLLPGTNVLALHALNSSKSDPDFLISAELTGYAYEEQTDNPTYFVSPTPGKANGLATGQVGPLVYSVKHAPSEARVGEPLLVTAAVQPSFKPVGEVALLYRIMFASVTNKIVMLDDGQHGDGQAGDGVYGAWIPGESFQPGQMIRYAVQALDTSTNVTRSPSIEKNRVGPRYWGTIVEDNTFSTKLPVFHWFMQNPGTAESGGEASIYFNKQFLDNVRFSIHGQSSQGFPKKSYNIDLNPGYGLVPKDGLPAVDDINFMTTYPDKAHMRNMLAYETYREADTPYHLVFPIRVQQNTAFWGDAHFMDNGDENYLKRLGLDSNGALYKMYNSFETPDGEKKTRKSEGNVDLKALYDGLGLTGNNLTAYIYDNLNLPEIVSYLASMTIVANTDCCHKNYYYYRDSEGTGEWQMLAWDQDLSFGRVWSSGPSYWDDTIYTNTALRIGNGNRLASVIFNNPVLDQMYLRRLRTLMEEVLQAPGTPPYLLRFEKQIDDWADQMEADAALDLAKWGTFSGNASSGSAADGKNKQTLREAANFIKYEFLPGRRNWLYNNAPNVPKSQPANVNILVSGLEYNPVSGNQEEEYIRLTNTNSVFVDITGWKLEGAVDFTFRGGTVIPTNGVLYVSPNPRAFRARSVSPRGGERLFVTGPYQGQLSARGETITLVDKTGRTVSTLTYPGTPSAAQNALRVTEIMYHPPAVPVSSAFPAEEYEYIEVRNTGSTSLDLNGVRFSGGIRFAFTGSSITNLAAGARAVIARNIAAFQSRYGLNHPLAGAYDGYLSGSGERIQLIDAQQESILDFTFSDQWYPITDGYGFSLVINDDLAPWNTWGDKASWHPSGKVLGSPGSEEPSVPSLAPILISEVLAHSTAPETDAIELFNPTDTPVNLGGWYLTDDSRTPKKYRIAANTLIPAKSWLVIRESQFNSGANAFALSSGGDEIYLFSGDAAGELTGYFHGFRFDASPSGVSWGLHTTSESKTYAVLLGEATLGTSNTPPRVGPVILSELMYHPAPSDRASSLEYLELFNPGNAPAPLFDPTHPTNTWAIQGGIEWAFPTNLTLAAGERVVLVSFDPAAAPAKLAAFRTHYGMSTDLRILGPFQGSLNNAEDDVALYAPDLPDASGKVNYYLVDWVHYKDAEPWPALPDGFGPALHRRLPAAFGNEPLQWFAAKPSPGYAEPQSTPPQITTQPVDQVVVAGNDLVLQSAASGSGSLAYQWLLNGDAIPDAVEPVYVRQDLSLWDYGAYQMLAMNGAGAVLSSNALVKTLKAAVVLKQPEDRNVVEGSNTTFTVTALGNGKLSYQWLYEGSPLPGATTSNLTLRGVTLANEGSYSVEITDSVGKIVSAKAKLVTYDRPAFTVQPQSLELVAGETAVFAAAIQGRGPFGYTWQRNGSARTNLQSALPYSLFALRNVASNIAGNYSVTVTNPAGIRTNSAVAKLTILADQDKDGMPDIWESTHGLNPAQANDATLDSDGDGISNLDEYRAGTDPQSAGSYLRITRIALESGFTTLEFPAESNRTYTVEFRENAAGGNWQTLATVFAQPTARTEVITDPYPLAEGRVYRIVAPAVADRPLTNPVIIRAPESITPFVGAPVSLSVSALGNGNLSYQWLKSGQVFNRPGMITDQPVLTFGAVKTTDQGVYSVRVTDSLGNVVSQEATLTVLVPPVISQQPASTSAAAGSTVTFSVVATGNGPLTYIWLHNGIPVPGAQSPTLTLTQLTASQAGAYSVVIRHNTSNGLVATESDSATLTIP